MSDFYNTRGENSVTIIIKPIRKGILKMNTFEKARQFVYRNARPLDLARWQYHFEGGSSDAVLKALAFYQNEDGGFGHGIEPDFLNPNSSPIATWAAAEILREIDFKDKNHPIVKGILKYLGSGADFDREHNQWLNTIPSNNDFPHAIWWEYNGKDEFKYNPTAALAGFIIRFEEWDLEIYKKALEIVKEAVQWFTDSVPFTEQHVTGCFISLYEALLQRKIPAINMELFEEKLKEQVKYNICGDTDKWKTEYVAVPADFFLSPQSIFYNDNREPADYAVKFIGETQLQDGSYAVPWQWWTDYKEFEVSANMWRSAIIIKNLRYLKEFGAV